MQDVGNAPVLQRNGRLVRIGDARLTGQAIVADEGVHLPMFER